MSTRIRRASLWEEPLQVPRGQQRTPAEIAFDAVRCEHYMYGLYRCRGLAVRDGLCATCIVLGLVKPAPHVALGAPPAKTVVCSTCNDTHTMWMTKLEREVPCTFCPRPCADCRQHLGAYCQTTPCKCNCHRRTE